MCDDYRMKLMSLLSVWIFLLGGCAMSNVEKEYGPLKHIQHLEVSKYMGTWYVIASIPTFFEKGANNAVETYSWNEANQRIDVDFHFNADSPNGKFKSYPQKAFIYDHESNAEWRVQPFWPLKLAYLVVDLAPDYSYTIVGVPSRKYVWIMARKPKMDDLIYQQLIDKLKQVGYDISRLQKAPQSH
jgi:apolipoprotein D and lipocalin family protein